MASLLFFLRRAASYSWLFLTACTQWYAKTLKRERKRKEEIPDKREEATNEKGRTKESQQTNRCASLCKLADCEIFPSHPISHPIKSHPMQRRVFPNSRDAREDASHFEQKNSLMPPKTESDILQEENALLS